MNEPSKEAMAVAIKIMRETFGISASTPDHEARTAALAIDAHTAAKCSDKDAAIALLRAEVEAARELLVARGASRLADVHDNLPWMNAYANARAAVNAAGLLEGQ